jgi:hypothetical protein
VKILAGTDAGMNPHGVVAQEIRLLHSFGLPAAAAVAAGSWEARAFLGLPGIEVGAPADLVVFPDDPLEDLAEVLQWPLEPAALMGCFPAGFTVRLPSNEQRRPLGSACGVCSCLLLRRPLKTGPNWVVMMVGVDEKPVHVRTKPWPIRTGCTRASLRRRLT